MKINIVVSTISKLYHLLQKKHKIIWGVLVFFTVGLSLIETIGISVIMPFISVASNPELLDSGWYKKAFDFFGFTDIQSFLFIFGIVIVFFYLFRAVYSASHVYLINRFSQAIYRFFSQKLFSIFLSVPYRVFVQKNTAEMTQITNGMSQRISHLTVNILNFFSELFTVVLVYALLVTINWRMTLVLTIVLAVIVVCFLFLLVSRAKAHGTEITSASLKMSRTLRETFGNFKFVKLKGSEKSALDKFGASIEIYNRAHVINSTLGAMPKIILESLGFSLLVVAVIAVLRIYKDASQVIPIISMYALALYRILPSIHRMLGNVNTIAFSQRPLELVDENIRQPVENEGSASVDFNRKICIKNVSFKYLSGGDVLDSVTLEINKGERVAITGESGGGKSTLVDIIIGIHKPVSGALFIDDTEITSENIRSWRNKIGYIPQSIYLFDGTVADNIIIGSKFDEEKIIKVLRMANIWDFLAAKEGIHTKVGEGGIQLSGGQQQRVGIARALYNDPDVLVLDEATSALDNNTEEKIMEEIYTVSENKTLIIIAHRLSTVERCERKICMENGKLTV